MKYHDNVLKPLIITILTRDVVYIPKDKFVTDCIELLYVAIAHCLNKSVEFIKQIVTITNSAMSNIKVVIVPVKVE